MGKACHNLLCTITGSTFRQSNRYSSHALVLVRYKACRRCLRQETDADNHNNKTGQDKLRFTDAAFNVFHVFGQRSCKPIIKCFYSLADKALRCLLLLHQNQGAERRSQGQRNNRRKHHGYGNRNRKLLIQFTNSTAGEGYRDKYRRQYEGDSHNRAGNLVHSAVGCLLRRHTVFLNMMLYCLYYNDSVIDNKADSQNHCESSQSVDSKAQNYEGSEGTNQGYRYSQNRNQGCTPAAQEHEYYQNNQNQSFNEGMCNLLQRLGNKLGVILNNNQLHIVRETAFSVL